MKRSGAVWIALALVGEAAGARAAINVGDNLTITGAVAPGQETGFVSYDGGTAVNCYAGVLSVSVLDTTQGGPAFKLQTFCTDVGAAWQSSPQQYTAKAFAGATGVNPLWAYTPLSIQNAAWLYNQYFVGQIGLTAAQTAGIQLAIWKVLYDTVSSGQVSASFTTGNFQATGFGGLTYAATLINALDAARLAGTFTTYTGPWLAPNAGNTQGLLGPGASVPETTATLAALCLLGLPLGAGVRRTWRRKSRLAERPDVQGAAPLGGRRTAGH